jgi:hypothetical protein
MRFLAGDARWCHARILQGGKPATRADVAQGGEGMGPVLGDHINATYGFDAGVEGTFGSVKNAGGKETRFGLEVRGTRGVVQLTTGSLPAAYFLDDPSWFPGRSKAPWQEISSAGPGKPEPLKDGGLGQGNVWIARDLIAAVEKDRQPLGGMYDGRAALEMILAVYESHRLQGTAELPLKNRKHPLALMTDGGHAKPAPR